VSDSRMRVMASKSLILSYGNQAQDIVWINYLINAWRFGSWDEILFDRARN